MEKIGLSKSGYCSGLQCPKILWLRKNKPNEANKTDKDSVLENGTMVGEVARGYFGEYSSVATVDDKYEMVNETVDLMEKGAENITEASFITNGLYCAVDILHKDEDGWDIVEVKSSTKVDDIYKEDAAFQYYVLKECGVNVKKVYILYINNEYVRHGDLNLKTLFKLEDLTLEAESRSIYIPDNIEAMRNWEEGKGEPDIDIDMYCKEPYECEFKAYCWKHIPTPSIFDINNLKKKVMFSSYKAGIITFDQVKNSDVKLSDKQKKQVDFSLRHLPDYINKSRIQAFLDTLTYPLYHLDFETFQQAIPEWEGGKPYAQIPFQYSLHIEYEDGRLEHMEFLAKEGTDPRRAIAESLCKDIPIGVCSLAYNMGFEKGRLKELADLFPDLANHLLDIRANMHDIMVPFQQGDYYSEAMKGSYSIKYVLPALYPDDPELDYHNLDEVHNGTEASSAFLTMAKKTPEEIAKLRANLLKYCGLDTYAMVKVLQKLRETVE
ncbi:MAG: DUF2779 domain-containing protein [Lachnospiraceae bacterium]|nr:DUF2779 domain-containing protein [Lachnospiraceae bacterium]